MTPSGIEPATFRFVAQHLNHCATAVPQLRVFEALKIIFSVICKSRILMHLWFTPCMLVHS